MALRILYFANHDNTGSDNTEEHITFSLFKLGCDVTKWHERDWRTVPTEGYDLLLFHKGGPRILDVLQKVKYAKAFWYFDKVWKDRPEWFAAVMPLVDIGFLTDGTWFNAHQEQYGKKLYVLRQGIGETDEPLPPANSSYTAKIAFTGSVYQGREQFVDKLTKEYEGDFQVFSKHFNRALYELCASVPIIVAPPFPSDDHYWSSRVYITLGSGGFLLHPKCRELALEYGPDELVTYSSWDELVDKIGYYLKNPEQRKIIQKAGYEKTIASYTYTERCKSLLRVIQRRLNIGMSA